MLEQARELGFLGPGPVDAHLDHAGGFVDAVLLVAAGLGGSEVAPGRAGAVDRSGAKVGELGPAMVAQWPARAVDLGSGGGVPGLPLAMSFPECEWLLVESAARRAAFLRETMARLGLDDRVEVAEERAELVGRSPAKRGVFDLVVARSFGPPAVVAECGAPLLCLGGRVVVSEPPGGAPARWPAQGLKALGMWPEAALSARGWAYQVVQQRELCPDRYPRRVGMPAKRPLF